MNLSEEEKKTFYSLSHELGLWIEDKEINQGINIIIILVAFMYVIKLFTQQVIKHKICTVEQLHASAKMLDDTMDKRRF